MAIVLTGSANPDLGRDIAKRVFLIQPTSAPVEQHLFEHLDQASDATKVGSGSLLRRPTARIPKDH